MVNLVVRHGASHLLPTSAIHGAKSSAAIATNISRERVVPSPIRVPSHSKRPVSPLTTSESLFGNPPHHVVEQSRSQSSSEKNPPRGIGSTERLDPAFSRDSSIENDLVCDYDQNVTVLYELLESSQWDQVRLRCRTHPEEVQTWIVRRAGPQTRWKLLPLHAAVIFQAPAPVIEGMLKEYPIAAGKRDDQGMLPLHLAFRHKQEESMVRLLLAQYPQAVMVKDRRDRLPLDHGRESHFSASLLQAYAEACVKSQKPQMGSVVEDMRARHEIQLEGVKTTYENRMAALRREHDEEIREVQQKMDQDQLVIQTQYIQEMDELRDLLSREVATGQRLRQSQGDVQELQHALSQANSENQILRGVIEEQKAYYEDLQGNVQKIVEGQKTLQAYCAQQQQELEETQQLREQLLRSLMQKEDGSAVRGSREISQLSENIRLRTEQFLTRVASVPTATPGPEEVDAPPGTNDQHHIVSQEYEQNNDEIGDDISAITDDHF